MKISNWAALLGAFFTLFSHLTHGATVTWKAAVSGNWTDGSKWSSGTPPAVGDSVIIDAAGTYAVNVNSPATLASLSLTPASGRVTLGLNTGTFDVNGPGIVNSNGVVQLTPGAILGGSGNFTIAGRFEWTGGQIQGNGLLTLSPGSTAVVTSGGQHTLRDRRIVNGTRVDWSSPGPDYFGFGAFWENQPGATLDFKNDAQLYFWGGVPAIFQNAGTLVKSGGTGQLYFDCQIQNLNTVAINTGTLGLRQGGTLAAGWIVGAGATLALNGGTFSNHASSAFSGSGRYLVAGGTYNVATTQSTGVYFELAPGGILQGEADLTLTGRFDWTGGQIGGSGNLVFSPTAVVSVLPGGQHTLRDRRIVNQTTVNWTSPGPDYMGFSSTWENAAGSKLDLKNDAQVYFWGGTPTAFQNAGVFVKSGGSGTAYFDCPFQNLNSFAVNTGTLLLRQGGTLSANWTVAAGATLGFNGATFKTHASTTLAGNGRYLINGGTYEVATAQTTDVRLELAPGGILQGAAELTVDGQFDWTGGQIAGDGRLIFGPTAVVSVLPGGQHTLRDRRIVNQTTVEWTSPGPDYMGFSSNWENAAGSTLDLKNDAQVYFWGGTPTVFQNAGVVVKSGGAGVAYFDCQFQNLNSFAVNSGTLFLRQGGTLSAGWSVGAGATLGLNGGVFRTHASTALSGAGRYVINGGTYDVAVNQTTGVFLELAPGGILQGDANLTLTGRFDWTGGQISGAGNLSLNAGSVVSILPGGQHTFRDRRVINRTTVNWTSTGPDYMGFGSVWENTAGSTFDMKNAAQIYFWGGTPTVFQNAGTFVKSGGAAIAYLDCRIENSGTFSVNAGNLYLRQGGLLASAWNVGSGATLVFNGNTFTTHATTAFGGGGKFQIAGATYDVTVAQNTDAYLELAPGGILQGTADLTLNGQFDWSGGQISGTGRLILTPAAVASVLPGGQHTLRDRRVINGASVSWTSPGPDYVGFGAVWENQSGATLDLQSVINLYYWGGAPGSFQNAGNLLKSAGNGLSYFDFNVQNAGTVTLQSGDLAFRQGFTQSAGRLQLFGGNYEGSPSLLDIRGGVLEGGGRIGTGVSVAGELRPGNPLGKLEINPNWNTTNTPISRSFFQLGGTQAGVNYDQFFTAGGLNVGGEVRIEFANGFEPTGGDVFEIMRGATRKGTFSATNAPAGFSSEVTYSATNVTLRLIKTGVVPPQITTPPASLAVNDGGTASFTVTATGSGLSYQWRRNGVNLDGANASTLTLNPVTFSHAGSYDVIVSNSGGSDTSVPAILTVNPTSLESGLLARYALDESAADALGNRNGTVFGPVSYLTNAPRNRAVRFPFGSYVQLGANPQEPLVNSAEPFSASFWIRPRSLRAMVPVRLATPEGEFAFYLSSGENGDLATHFGFRGHVGPATVDPQAAVRSQLGCWLHVTVVYLGGSKDNNASYAAYFNGAALPLPGNVSLSGGTGLNELGRNLPGFGGFVDGDLDEVRIYGRALRPEDATALAANPPDCPPEIVTQPVGFAINPGLTASLTVSAIGAQPLSYQWLLEGSPVNEATNAFLQRINIQAAQAGSYSVVVSNQFGAVTSSNAVVVLNLLRPEIATPPVATGVYPGETATFTVQATGLNLTYLWRRNNVVVDNGTGATLQIANVGDTDAGSYTVEVRNAAGAAFSQGVPLWIIPRPDAQGRVAYYPLNGNLDDAVGNRNAVAAGGVEFVNGARDQAFAFNGGRYLQMGDGQTPFIKEGAPFSVSFWMRPTAAQSMTPIRLAGVSSEFATRWGVSPNDGTTAGAGVYFGFRGALAIGTAAANSYLANHLGCWTHFTFNYKGGSPDSPANYELFLDGQSLPLQNYDRVGGSLNSNELGRDQFTALVVGAMDDVQILARTQSATEALSLAENAPACTPEILFPPAGGTVTLNGSFSFFVNAIGGPSLQYQWLRNGDPIPGAQDRIYQINGATVNDNGSYQVRVSNTEGSTLSTPVALIVAIPPPPGLATLNTGTTNFITGASFLNRNFGFISQLGGGVSLTANGGATWNPLNTGITTDLNAIQLIGGVSYIAGANGVICISTNNGSSWTAFNTGTSATFYGLTFNTPSSGWAVGSGGIICRYNGRTWVPTSTGVTIDFYASAFGGDIPWAAGAAGTICRYVGGAWQAVNTGTAASFYSIAFRGENRGLAVGSGGIICRYNGTAWIPVNSGTTANIRSVVWADDNTAYITGDGGLLCISTNGGLTWTPLGGGGAGNLGGLAVSGGAGFVFGAGGSGLSFVVPAQPANLPPNIRIIEPVTNQQFFACYDIPIRALASDPDGQIVKVEFFRGQFKLGETTRIPTLGRPLISRFHTDVFGFYELRAVATDNLGAVTVSDPVTIEVIPPPLYTAVADGYSDTDGMSICYLGLVGSNYVLQATSALDVPVQWENLSTNQMPELLLRVLDPGATNRPLRFYRFMESR